MVGIAEEEATGGAVYQDAIKFAITFANYFTSQIHSK